MGNLDSTTNLTSGYRSAVFLDRDGVINRMVYNPDFGLVDSPHNVDQFQLLPGVPEAVPLLNEMGLFAVVVSNQPGIAKGKFTPAILESMTDKMHHKLAELNGRLDAVYYCLHHPDAILQEHRVVCDCRKPKPGLLKKAAMDLEINLGSSFMIGDGLTDILAGRDAGCTTILLGEHKCDACEMMHELDAWPDFLVSDLMEAVKLIQHHRFGRDTTEYRFCKQNG